jgi:hypothetical protein
MNGNNVALGQIALNLIAQGAQILQQVQAAHASGQDMTDAQVAQALADAKAAQDQLDADIAKA